MSGLRMASWSPWRAAWSSIRTPGTCSRLHHTWGAASRRSAVCWEAVRPKQGYPVTEHRQGAEVFAPNRSGWCFALLALSGGPGDLPGALRPGLIRMLELLDDERATAIGKM